MGVGFNEKLGVYQIKYAIFIVSKFDEHIYRWIRLEKSISQNGRHVSKKCVLHQIKQNVEIVEISIQCTGILKIKHWIYFQHKKYWKKLRLLKKYTQIFYSCN